MTLLGAGMVEIFFTDDSKGYTYTYILREIYDLYARTMNIQLERTSSRFYVPSRSPFLLAHPLPLVVYT